MSLAWTTTPGVIWTSVSIYPFLLDHKVLTIFLDLSIDLGDVGYTSAGIPGQRMYHSARGYSLVYLFFVQTLFDIGQAIALM